LPDLQRLLVRLPNPIGDAVMAVSTLGSGSVFRVRLRAASA